MVRIKAKYVKAARFETGSASCTFVLINSVDHVRSPWRFPALPEIAEVKVSQVVARLPVEPGFIVQTFTRIRKRKWRGCAIYKYFFKTKKIYSTEKTRKKFLVSGKGSKERHIANAEPFFGKTNQSPMFSQFMQDTDQRSAMYSKKNSQFFLSHLRIKI